MSASKRFSAILSLFIVFISACKAGTPPPIPITTLNATQGGKISYGTVAGATTQPAAMSKILISMQNTCGERPQIGKVFQFKGTKTVGVFFTVTDHSKGNKKLAGLVLSAASGPRQVEAALLSDDAQRFGKTVNPMLKQLFSVWHPDSQPAASGSSAGVQSASTGSGHSASATRLHTVTASDNSASIGIPDGWQLDPNSASSTMALRGPNGEQVVFGAMRPAVDPYNPQQVQAVRYGIYKGTGTILYPYHQDLAKAYPDLLQAWRRALNLPPAKLQVDKIEPMQGAGNCVLVTGHIDADGQGMKKLIDDICQSPPAQWGAYTITRNFNIMTDAQSEREQSTVVAMIPTYKINQQVMNQQMQQKLAQKQQSDQQWRAWGQQQSDRIRAQGEAAQRNFADRQAANDAQHASYWDQQNRNAAQHADWNEGQINNARNGQGFNNYILDQTVVQGNALDGTGAVGHATVWNTTAEALVKLDPNRFEIVDTPNYWLGTDFHQ
ncbi:MAG TPA: hypothetical protein VKF63_05465 [Terracidiphilus sp.]|nr:hypothetical protein [Terracidiphilus sp.]